MFYSVLCLGRSAPPKGDDWLGPLAMISTRDTYESLAVLPDLVWYCLRHSDWWQAGWPLSRAPF